MRFVALLLAAAALAPAASAADPSIVPTPIGVGPAFQPRAATPTGDCRARDLHGRVHVELFAKARVIVVPAGIGVGPGCRARLWTEQAGGVVHLGKPGLKLRDLFEVWRQPFGPERLLSFRGAVRVYVNGQQVRSDVPLVDGDEIVVETGPYIPPHRSYLFRPLPFSAQWSLDPAVLAGALVALALFAQAFVRLRRRGRRDHAGWGRAVLFTAGVAAATLALVSPIDQIGEDYLLWVHMAQHALLLDVAPLLLLLALRGPLTFFLLPAATLRTLAPLRGVLHPLLRPRNAFLIWLAIAVAWHVPAAFEFALAHPWAHVLEHVSFLVAGLLLWSQLVDPARRGLLSAPQRALYAAAVILAAHAILHPLYLGGGVLYSRYAEQPVRLLGLSAVADQHWAAWTMTVDQLLTLGVAALVLLRRGARYATVPLT